MPQLVETASSENEPPQRWQAQVACILRDIHVERLLSFSPGRLLSRIFVSCMLRALCGASHGLSGGMAAVSRYMRRFLTHKFCAGTAT